MEVRSISLWLSVRYPQLGSVLTAGGFGGLAGFLFVVVFCKGGGGVVFSTQQLEDSEAGDRSVLFRCLNSFGKEALVRCIRPKVRALRSHLEDLSPGLGCDTNLLWVSGSLV